MTMKVVHNSYNLDTRDMTKIYARAPAGRECIYFCHIPRNRVITIQYITPVVEIKNAVLWYITDIPHFVATPTIYVTEFWKITHMGVREIIRIFMFSGLLIRTGHRFENISRIFL